jgi:DNA polymerase-3 subunit epsilon
MDRRAFLETISLPAISLLPLRQNWIRGSVDRKVVIAIDTTGPNPADGYRIVEIAAVEIVGQRISGVSFRLYLNPDRNSDANAPLVHELTEFIGNSILIFHGAPHYLEFLKQEFSFAGHEFAPARAVIDTFELAREKQFSHAFLENLFAPIGIEPDNDTLAFTEAIWVARLYLATTA